MGSNFKAALQGSAISTKQNGGPATRTRTSSLLAWSSANVEGSVDSTHAANGSVEESITSTSAPASGILNSAIRPGLSRFGTHLASGWGASGTRQKEARQKEDRRARGSIEEEVVDEEGTLHGSDSVFEEGRDVDAEREWGLREGMELFEVSAKDDTGKFSALSKCS